MQMRPYFALFITFLAQCSEPPATEAPPHIVILDEIPAHIRSLENLTVFPGDSEPMYSMELVPVQSFGDNDDVYAAHIVSCAEDNHGRAIITILDLNYANQVFAFNADGTLHSQVGRQGKGPGEYVITFDGYVTKHYIHVFDFTSQRLNEYSIRDYSFVRSIPFDRWKSPDGLSFENVEPREDGLYQITYSDNPSTLGRHHTQIHVLDADGDRIHPHPMVFPAGFNVKSVESDESSIVTFLGQTITTLTDDPFLHAVWTHDFLIKTYDADGKYRSAIYYPIQSAYRFDLDEYVESDYFSPPARDIQRAVNADEGLPDVFPIVDDVLTDDENNIWVAVPFGANREFLEWWVLKKSGELLAKIQLHEDQRILVIRNGHIYLSQKNEESGTEHVVKYRMEMTGK